jgi:16S rRNA processing protein RimM
VSNARTRILLGRIGAAHGLRGEVFVQTFTAMPEDVAGYGPLTDKSGSRSFDLRVVRSTAKGLIVRIAGVADRTGAEKLRGTELYVDRDRLPAPSENEFYHSDLIGLPALSPEGEPIGRIVSVENYGAGDLLEIALVSGGQTELIPFTDAFVPEVDIPAGRVVVRMPVVDPDQDNEDQSDEEEPRPSGRNGDG